MLTNFTRSVLYIGVTNDLTRRLHEHSTGRGDTGKFTGRYQANLLVYLETWPDAAQAITWEKQLKGLSRAKKDALVFSFNPAWQTIDLETWAG